LARSQIDQLSRQQGLGRANIQLLEAVKGLGRDLVATSLLSILQLPDTGRTDDGLRHRVEGPWFSLLVFADGDRVTYRDYSVLNEIRFNPLPANAPLPAGTLVEWGRAFIEARLAQHLSFSPNETLVPLKTRYQHQIVQSESDGNSYQDSIVSSVVVFGREVNGVLVVGKGSKIAIELANDGRVAGFDYDWARLNTNATSQALLGIDALLRRSAMFNVAPHNPSVRNFECGYYDLGSRDRKSSLIQAGCVAYVVTRATSHPVTGEPGEFVVSALVRVIPAASRVIPDAGWPEAMRICSQDGSCSDSSASRSAGVPTARK
jgi:hypothetical protein